MRRNTHSTVSPVARRFPIPEPILSRRFVPLSQSMRGGAAPPTDPQKENTHIRHQDGQDALDYQTNTDGHRVPSGFFKWMWDDAMTGRLAAHNPLRWQKWGTWKDEERWKSASNIIGVLTAAAGSSGERPVRVRYKANYNDRRSQEDEAFANIGEAVIWIHGKAQKRKNQLLFGPLYDASMAVPSTQLLGVGGVRISPLAEAEEAAARGRRRLDEIQSSNLYD